ncbi:outer membrane protein [Palleronia marisminoris]|uniref:Outer membrane efflux protein BepC n=1 Tax=Palleronia marisminoris TaxID=315423 RepID=A0A1Y5S694_9RHOB|nr:TolC family outer membrane protein [Palleronia marisminoris]SFG64665.1 outer membrane protein [Palleronia marisminoris]SLN33464.1 Outer membrane efflux protein BepC precursor [Palleronia marisminoris]
MRLRFVIRAGVAAIAMLAGAASASAETLADTFILAYRHSGLLEKNRAVLRAADEDVATAIAQLRPILNYTVQAQQSYTNPSGGNSARQIDLGAAGGGNFGASASASAGISANLLLYDGGATRLGIDVAKETVLAVRQGLIQVEQQVLYNAVIAYLAVREATAFINLRLSNVELLQEQLRAGRERFEVGEVTRTDVALAEAQLASAQSQLAAARGDLQVAISTYVQVVGQEPGTLQPIGNYPQTASSLEAAQNIARKNHPNILQDMRAITIAELNVLRAEAQMRPSISGTASLSVDDDFTETGSFGLQLSGPIYQGGALTAAYRQAVARRDESRADLHITVDAILQEVAQAWSNQQVALASIEAGQLEVRAAQVAFEGLQEEVSLGARTTLDVLDSEQDLQDARAALISAQIAEFRAAYTLLYTMGLLTVEHLGLGITTYDPSAYYNAVKDAPIRRVSPQGEKLDRIIQSLGR